MKFKTLLAGNAHLVTYSTSNVGIIEITDIENHTFDNCSRGQKHMVISRLLCEAEKHLASGAASGAWA